jgi:hypothetical protein
MFEESVMNDRLDKNSAQIMKILNDDWEERSPEERRSDKDNRNGQDASYFKNGGKERRRTKERRQTEERRDGWLRVGQWRSEAVFDNK